MAESRTTFGVTVEERELPPTDTEFDSSAGPSNRTIIRSIGSTLHKVKAWFESPVDDATVLRICGEWEVNGELPDQVMSDHSAIPNVRLKQDKRSAFLEEFIHVEMDKPHAGNIISTGLSQIFSLPRLLEVVDRTSNTNFKFELDSMDRSRFAWKSLLKSAKKSSGSEDPQRGDSKRTYDWINDVNPLMNKTIQAIRAIHLKQYEEDVEAVQRTRESNAGEQVPTGDASQATVVHSVQN